MKQAVFITGFNNWGKSTIIRDLFGDRQKFFYGYLYNITGVSFATQFTVESHSNDDEWGQAWYEKIKERIESAPDGGQNIFTALCPTLHDNNNFIDLLRQPLFAGYDRLHIFLIEYKWEHHAKLVIENITNAGRAISNANFIVIDNDRSRATDIERWNAKINQIRSELGKIF